jgi:polyhydroxyalkanoate synthase
MSDKVTGAPQLPDPEQLNAAMAKVAEQSARLFAQFLERNAKEGARLPDPADFGAFGRPFQAYMEQIVANPAKLIDAQVALWQDYMELWRNVGQRLAGGEPPEPVAEPAPGDRRFKDPEWNDNP